MAPKLVFSTRLEALADWSDHQTLTYVHRVNCVSPRDRKLSGLDSLVWKTPRKCFLNKHRKEKVKRFREKVGGWNEQRPLQKTEETENTIICEGQRVKGQRTVMRKGEDWQEAEEKEIKYVEMSWCVSLASDELKQQKKTNKDMKQE